MSAIAQAIGPVILAAAGTRIRKARSTDIARIPTFRGACLDGQAAEREFMFAGPAETGKTYAGLWRLDSEARKTPRATAVIIRKVRADMDLTVLRTWERIIAIRGGVSKFGGERAQFYIYPNGARVWIVGLDNPGKVLSGELDFAYVNQTEEIALEDWEYLATRTTGRGTATGRTLLFGDCNPGPPTHWILSRPSLRVLHSHHTDNPTLYDDAGVLTEQGQRTMAVLETLTGVRRERLLKGKWHAAEGVVYEEFDRGVHIVAPFEIPKDWRRFRSIDFGYTNPFVCQWWAADPDGRAYLYREIYRTQCIVEDHAAEIKRLSGDERYSWTVADHDAEDRATLERHGISTLPAFKSVSVGIQAVQTRLRSAGDGKARMFVFADALRGRDSALAASHKPTCTAEEFEVYEWPKNASGKPQKEEPVKESDHGMDAMRYFVASLDHIGGVAEIGWLDMFEKAAKKNGKVA